MALRLAAVAVDELAGGGCLHAQHVRQPLFAQPRVRPQQLPGSLVKCIVYHLLHFHFRDRIIRPLHLVLARLEAKNSEENEKSFGLVRSAKQNETENGGRHKSTHP